MSSLLIVLLVVLLFGGGGYYFIIDEPDLNLTAGVSSSRLSLNESAQILHCALSRRTRLWSVAG